MTKQSPALPDIDSLWNYQDAAASEKRFRELIPRASESGQEQYLAELLTQIARAEGLQGRFEDANQDLDRAEALIGPYHRRQRVRLLLERGRALNSSGHPAEALPVFIEAVELASEASEEFLAVDAAHMVAIVEEPKAALEWNLRALEMARNATDERAAGWQGSLLNNIGWTHHSAGRYEDALSYFEQALAYEEERQDEWATRVARWTVARCLRSLGRVEEALVIQERNLKVAHEASVPDGFIQEELGECLLALGRPEDAKPHFARAYEQLSQDRWLVQGEPERMERIKELSSA